jgi:ADP-ribosyl-[dinitrogen reductase] hydrolase
MTRGDRMHPLNRAMGTLLGLACASLGRRLRFRALGTFEPISYMVGGGPFRLNPGEWTEDKSRPGAHDPGPQVPREQ